MKCLKNLVLVLLIIILCLCTTSTYSASNDITTYSPACILIESKTGKIIYEKSAYEKMFPASTTKIMTAILALEHCQLTDVATASYEAVFSVPSRIY